MKKELVEEASDPSDPGHPGLHSTPFDMAVDCAHVLNIVCEEDNWEIPVYVVELAEELYRDEEIKEAGKARALWERATSKVTGKDS